MEWLKPTKPRTMDYHTFSKLPDFLLVREVRVRVEESGFRTTVLVIATTLLDTDVFTKADLAQLYRARWNAELDLRSLKQTMRMEILRCKTPELVRKEVWTHVLAYNLIHTVMAQAASREGVPPRTISFKATLQLLEAFRPVIASQAHRGLGHREALYRQLLRTISVHRVADRPDRFAPRMAKRRPKNYDRLKKPRSEIKLDMINRFTQI